MTADQFYWLLARVAGLSSYAALAIALLTGIAMRTAVLDWLGSNRAVRSLHEYTTVLWLPLGALHVVSLLLDSTARIGVVDVGQMRVELVEQRHLVGRRAQQDVDTLGRAAPDGVERRVGERDAVDDRS